jgi:hypothetical protein
MAGLVSQRATTTIKVVAREELVPSTYFALISDGLTKQGYVTEELRTKPDVNEWLRDLTHELISIANAFEVTTVLERRGDFINVRQSNAGP